MGLVLIDTLKRKVVQNMNTKVIFVGNYKGGVGKTTSVLNIAIGFSKKGKKVLVVDLDPQSSLSEILVPNMKKEIDTMRQLSDLPDKKTLNYVLELYIKKIQKHCSLDLPFIDAICEYNKIDASFDFIANSLFYRGGQESKNHDSTIGLDDIVLQMENDIEYLQILQQYIKEVLKNKKKYDYVIIDCPPTNNLLTKSAFLMSDYYIIPTILDGMSTKGVEHYIATVKKTYHDYCEESEDKLLYRHYFGEMAQLVGIFYTLTKGTVKYDQEERKIQEIMKDYGDVNLGICIPNLVDVGRETQQGNSTKASPQYGELCEKILDKIERGQS